MKCYWKITFKGIPCIHCGTQLLVSSFAFLAGLHNQFIVSVRCESCHGQAERLLDSAREMEDSIAVNLRYAHSRHPNTRNVACLCLTYVLFTKLLMIFTLSRSFDSDIIFKNYIKKSRLYMFLLVCYFPTIFFWFIAYFEQCPMIEKYET